MSDYRPGDNIAAAIDRLAEAWRDGAAATREWTAFNREREDHYREGEEPLRIEGARLVVRKAAAEIEAIEAAARSQEIIRRFAESRDA